MAKAKITQALVATDSRLPLTVAIAQALAAHQFSPEFLAVRKKELAELVSEAAKTFGFQSKTSLSKAFDLSTGLLSLALVHSGKGEPRPDQWIEKLLAENWKNLAKEAINLVRTAKEKDAAHNFLFESDKDPIILRAHLQDFALRRDRHQQWVGYAGFCEYQEARLYHQTADALVRFLIKLLVKRPLHWRDAEDAPTGADEALNTLLFRQCTGLGFGQKDIILTEKDFRRVREEYDQDPAAWLKQVEKRYQLLLIGVPEEMLSALDKNWVQKHFVKGPPKVKKWESEDLPGITGMYFYQVYS